MTRAFAIAAMVAAAAALGACGKKGDPEYPDGKQYETITRDDGSTKKVPKKPTRPFVLDPLLN